MKTILIFYEHISREYDACIKIKEVLERDIDVRVYVFSLHFQVLDAMLLSLKCKIDMIVVPYAYKENSLKPISGFLNKSPIPYIVNLHHEQIGAVYNEERLFPIDEVSKNRVIHFVWTDFFRDKMINRGVKEELIKVTGNIRTDLIKYPKVKDRTQLAKDFNLDIYKKWILLCESGITPYTELEMIKKEKQGLLRSDMIEYNEVIERAYHETVLQMNNLDDSFFINYELIYRAHPGTVIKQSINSKVKVISERSLYEWLGVIDLNISRVSTALYESEINQIPSIRYNPTEYPVKFLTYGLENFVTIQNLKEINNELINEVKLSFMDCKNYERYYGIVDGNSANRAANEIKEVLEKGIPSYSRERIDLRGELFLQRKYIMNVLSKIIIKYNLNFAKKWIKSLSIFRNDIPIEWFNREGNNENNYT